MSRIDTAPQETTEYEYDVVIVGGGPAGCSAGVFTARYDLDTIIFDRGRSSIQRCAYLENYLGFPAGIDIETLYGLMHDHAETAGCKLVSDLVESIERTDNDEGFIVETQEGRHVSTSRVIAATRYDGEYLRGLDDDEGMFVTHEHGGEKHEHFERTYAEHNGTTSIKGLYVASPSEEADHQAIMAAGRGARVGLTLVEDARQEQGYPSTLADHYDWIRRKAELENGWDGRNRWREYFDDRVPEDHDIDEEQRIDLREREIDRRFDQYLIRSEIDERTERGHEQLLEHIDDDLILKAAREIEAEQETADVSD